MKSNTNKNFEDQLRDRLQGEEMDFNPGAWERFEEKYSDNRSEHTSGNGKSPFWKVWGWFLPIALLLVGAITVLWYHNDSTLESNDQLSQNEIESTDGSENRNTKVLDIDNSKKSSKEISGEQEKNQIEKKYSNNILNTSAGNREEDVTSAGNTELKTLSKNSESENANKDNQSIMYRNKLNEKPNVDRKSITNTSLGTEGDLSTKSIVSSESTAFHPSSEPNTLSTNTEFRNSENTTPPINPDRQNQNSTNGTFPFVEEILSDNEITNSTSNSSNSENESSEKGTEINLFSSISPLASIESRLFFEGIKPEIGLYKIITPIRYSKNEFYIGSSFSNQLTANPVEQLSYISPTNTTISNQRSFSSKLGYHIGYLRKVSPNFGIGIEAKASSLRNINLTRPMVDYHQTSTTFEYIEGTFTHSRSIFLDLAFHAKYTPHNKPYGFYAGAKVGYVPQHSFRFDGTTNGENTVLEDLRAELTISKYVKNVDFGLQLGGTMDLALGIELDARINLGLTDLGDDYFWGNGREINSHYTVGINYRFEK